MITMVYKNCIIYTRLSKSSNSKYNNKNNSLDTQLQLCKEYAQKNNLNVKKVYSDIKSARKLHLLPQLNLLLKENNEITLLINTVDRLARNTIDGCKFIKKATNKKINIIFVSENLNTSDCDTVHIIRMKLSAAEKESDIISKRIKQAISLKRKRGEFLGNKTKFGYMTITNNLGHKFLVKNFTEQKVINFIVTIKKGKVSSLTASQLMYRICHTKDIGKPIHYYDKNNNVISHFTKKNALSYEEIANLLNEYKVPNRYNVQWDKKIVSRIYRDYKLNNKLPLKKLAKLSL